MNGYDRMNDQQYLTRDQIMEKVHKRISFKTADARTIQKYGHQYSGICTSRNAIDKPNTARALSNVRINLLNLAHILKALDCLT